MIVFESDQLTRMIDRIKVLIKMTKSVMRDRELIALYILICTGAAVPEVMSAEITNKATFNKNVEIAISYFKSFTNA